MPGAEPRRRPGTPPLARPCGLAAAAAAVPTALLALLVLGSGCDSGHPGGGGPTGPPAATSLALRPVGSGFDHPLLVTAAPADTARLFVVEQSGRIRLIKSGVTLGTPFLDLHTLTMRDGERGLLGLAFAPDYASTGRFYVSYTDLNGNSRIARYHVSADPDVAVGTADEIVLAVDQPASNHNGGMIAFGPDGMLWIGFGDGGGSDDTYGNGQSKDDLLGSLVRIDVSGGSGYAIPAGNPYTSPDRPELWNIGLRNPWRFSFDRQTGDLWIGDVGQDTREEIDVARASQGRDPGANYGWPIMEGRICRPPTTGCSTFGLTLPVLDYDHPAPPLCAAITGGYVYRGSAIPGLQGTYFYADYCAHWVRSFRLGLAGISDEREWPTLDPGAAIPSFGEDARGELYVCADDGLIYRIVAAP